MLKRLQMSSVEPIFNSFLDPTRVHSEGVRYPDVSADPDRLLHRRLHLLEAGQRFHQTKPLALSRRSLGPHCKLD